MPVSMDTVSGITKEIYEGPLRKQLNNEVVALRRIERSGNGIESNVGGKYVTFPIHYGRNSGIGARREMEDLPKAGNQATAAARVGLKYQYGSMQLSGQALALADTNTQAFISALDLETTGLKDDLAHNLNREVYGDGAGQIALITSGAYTANTTDIPVESGMDNLGINQIVDVYTTANLASSSGSPSVSAATITKVVDNEDGTGTIQLDKNVAATQIALTVAGSARREWTGLDAIVSDTGVLYNIDPADVSQWKGVVDDNSGSTRPLTEGRILTNVDKVRKRGGKTSLLLTSLGVRRSYFALLVQQRQFVNTSQENKDFEGGFTGLAFTTDQGEIPLVTDPFAPYNTMWGLSEKNLKLYRESDWSFLQRDGSMWKIVPGDTGGTIKDAYMATMFQYSEIGTDRRGVHFKIADIEEA